MIRVSVLYANEEGKKFDHEYYAKTHMPMVGERLKPLGLVRYEVDTGLSGGEPNSPPPYVAVAYLIFNSVEDFQKGMGEHGAEIMGDIPNYTDIAPQIQVSEYQEV